MLGHGVGLFSNGERISWAAGRRTSRPEDVAYSLMGLLGVNMPLLYGEGEKRSFIRLQLEAFKKSDDTSLFAWVPTAVHDVVGADLLASEPAGFACFDRGWSQYDTFWSFAPFYARFTLAPCVMTNRGLYLHVGAYHVERCKANKGSVLWCVPLSLHGSAIFLEHASGSDPRRSLVLASRSSLRASILGYKGNWILRGAKDPICGMKDLDPAKYLIHLTKDQRGRLESCEFYLAQSYV